MSAREVEPNAMLVSREDVNDELAIFRIVPDDPAALDFEPGQYAELSLGDFEEGSSKLLRRQYSIASAPGDPAGIELYIVRVEGGAFTPKLWSLTPGKRLWMNPKTKGKFTLEPVPPEKDLVMISTGTGLAPFISMLRKYRSTGRWRSYTVIHGVRYPRDLGYRQELEAAAQEDPTVFYLPTVTREPSAAEWSGHRGRVFSLIEDGSYERTVGYPFSPETCQVFLCGNPAMIDEIEEKLLTLGFKEHKKRDSGQIHIERYW